MTTTEYVTMEEFVRVGNQIHELLSKLADGLEATSASIRDVKGLTGIQQEQVTLLTESVGKLAEAVDLLNQRTS